MADYMPTSEKNVEGMYQELLSFISQIENKYLRQLAEYYFVKMKNLFIISKNIRLQRACTIVSQEDYWSILSAF